MAHTEHAWRDRTADVSRGVASLAAPVANLQNRRLPKLHGIKNSLSVRPSVHCSRPLALASPPAKKGSSPLSASSLSASLCRFRGENNWRFRWWRRAALGRRNPRQSILVSLLQSVTVVCPSALFVRYSSGIVCFFAFIFTTGYNSKL